MNKRAQQEMVGFVLIVVIVIIGLMVFMVISLKNPNEDVDSLAVSNMISSILKTTTECAISFEPQYDDFEDLFKSCYSGERCSNLDKDACIYLNESLGLVIEDLVKTEATIESYELDFLEKDSSGESGILKISQGSCDGSYLGAQRILVFRGDTLIVRLRVC